MKWKIRKLIMVNGEFKYITLRRYRSEKNAWKWLNSMGRKSDWTFHQDRSLFGGYWVNQYGECYGVA